MEATSSMNDTTHEAPERIWALADRRKQWQDEPPQEGQQAWHWIEYVRADRIEKLEAKLVKAVEGLKRIDDASIHFSLCNYASENTIRYAHESTSRLARTTLAELKGEKG